MWGVSRLAYARDRRALEIFKLDELESHDCHEMLVSSLEKPNQPNQMSASSLFTAAPLIGNVGGCRVCTPSDSECQQLRPELATVAVNES